MSSRPVRESVLTRPRSEIARRYDVVIVGSGYGGGVSASRLARAGKRVAVIEKGRELQPGQFPTRFPELRNEMRLSGHRINVGRADALFDVRLGDDMHVVVGCGVGGGSLINAGVALKPDPRVFADSVWPGELAQDGLIEEGYRRARAWLRPAAAPDAARMSKFQALDLAGTARGQRPEPAPVTIAFEAGTSASGTPLAACTRCGDCCGGCNVGAKVTVAATYLTDARRHGADIFAGIAVDHVRKGPDGWQVVAGATGDTGAPTTLIEAGMVILSAGTLGSTEILLRSRAAGLPVSERAGERFSANGDIIAFGWGAKPIVNAIGIGHPPRVETPVGAAVSGQIAYVDESDLARSVTVQEGVLPSAIAPALPLMFLPNGRLLGALQSLVSGVYNGPFRHLQTFFAVSHDSAAGRLGLEDGRLVLRWPGAKSEPVFERLNETLTGIVGAVGGSYVANPLAGPMIGDQPATAHPLGGAVMARSRDTGVVDHASRLFDPSRPGQAVHEGLYVIDGSIVPRSLGCNPLLTITALAERAMLHMERDLGLRFSPDPL
jgi:cholesterol oxidase